MNTVVTAPSRLQQHPPSVAIRRVGVLNRLALRLGLALIMWGRRPVRARTERYITHAEIFEFDRLEVARQRARLPLGPYV